MSIFLVPQRSDTRLRRPLRLARPAPLALLAGAMVAGGVVDARISRRAARSGSWFGMETSPLVDPLHPFATSSISTGEGLQASMRSRVSCCIACPLLLHSIPQSGRTA